MDDDHPIVVRYCLFHNPKSPCGNLRQAMLPKLLTDTHLDDAEFYYARLSLT
jgi:hypothetical protein